MSKLREAIQGKVRFKYYRDNALWYETENGFLFPVRVSDTGSATFLAEDRGILFMRWIRRYMGELEAAK